MASASRSEVEADKHERRSNESDVTAFAVVPTGSPSAPTEVTTVDPSGELPPSPRRQWAGETSAGSRPGPCMRRCLQRHESATSVVNGKYGFSIKIPYVMIFPSEIPCALSHLRRTSRRALAGPYGRRRAACPDCHHRQLVNNYDQFSRRSRRVPASRQDSSPAGHI